MVQHIPEAKIEDIQQNLLQDLLHEDFKTIVIHAGTNNLIMDTLQNILDKLIKLKRSTE